MPWPLLMAASLGMFTASATGITRAPFLIDMARDLSSSVPLIANLLAVTSIAWGLASMGAGAASDRWGRWPFLIGGPVALAGALTGVASAESFVTAAVWAALSGGCCGVFTGPIFTEVSRRVSATQQGRALGWVMSGQSLSLLIGVPLAAWAGSRIGWRGVSVCVAVLGVATSAGLFATATRSAVGGAGLHSRRPSMQAALSRPVLRLLSMGIAERICYGLVAVYFATFLQSTFGLRVDALAVPLAVFAAGNIVGTILGGQLADRLKNRLGVFAAAMLVSAVVALMLFSWRVNFEASVALGFFYVFFNAIARPSLMASLGSVPEHVRGTVMALNVTCSSVGWLGAAALGGWMIASYGFVAFGPLTMGVATLGAVLALARRS